MSDESRTKFFGVRVTPSYHKSLESLAAQLAGLENRPVRLSDLFWRLLDLGLPELQKQLEEANVAQCSNMELLLDSARRHFRRGQDCLDQVEGLSTKANAV